MKYFAPCYILNRSLIHDFIQLNWSVSRIGNLITSNWIGDDFKAAEEERSHSLCYWKICNVTIEAYNDDYMNSKTFKVRLLAIEKSVFFFQYHNNRSILLLNESVFSKITNKTPIIRWQLIVFKVQWRAGILITAVNETAASPVIITKAIRSKVCIWQICIQYRYDSI